MSNKKRHRKRPNRPGGAQPKRNLPGWLLPTALIGVVALVAALLLFTQSQEKDEAMTPVSSLAPEQRNGYYDLPPEMTLDLERDYRAVIVTERGDITIDLFEETTPKTVNNFVFLARQGFYDGVSFHRVLDGFMAQGGDPTGRGSGGPGYRFEDEALDQARFDRPGLLAMANAGPNTNGSQFFITFVPTPHLNGRHTVFGEVIEGFDVLDNLTRRNPQTNPSFPGDQILRIDIVENR